MDSGLAASRRPGMTIDDIGVEANIFTFSAL
jgi:hypothetical protein